MRRCTLLQDAALLGFKYSEFRPRANFNYDNYPHWFQGHMSKGRTIIQQKMEDVDILLEVRDARAPFSSAQFELTQKLKDNVQRLVVLNKADLITPNAALAARNFISDSGQPCLLTTATENRNLVKIKNFAMDNARAQFPRTLGLMLIVVGLPNVGKSTIINGLKRLTFHTARHQGVGSKLARGMKWTEAKTNILPGFTRNVRFFQLSNFPRLYCYDTPGVSLMKQRDDPERNTKLALLGCMPDHVPGEMYLADYLLYRLNKEQNFVYVEELGLPGPTDDVRYLTAHICGQLSDKNLQGQVLLTNPSAGAAFFLRLFRSGQLGKISLDHIPNPGEVHRLRLMQAETEPPGPWGPSCYPRVPQGLELDRLPPLVSDEFLANRRQRARENMREPPATTPQQARMSDAYPRPMSFQLQKPLPESDDEEDWTSDSPKSSRRAPKLGKKRNLLRKLGVE